MQSKESNPKFKATARTIVWISAWLLLIGLSLDFYNWGRVPRLCWGMPLWLWAEIGLVLLIALVFGLLARFTWEGGGGGVE